EVPIRNKTVLNAWQSSYFYSCFHERDQLNESNVLNTSQSFQFIHSNDKKHFNDSGFHWFAVQLSESVLIGSVTVKGSEVFSDAEMFRSSAGIEIWTSNSEEQLFSGNHCNSKNMSKQFNKYLSSWKRCGVTTNRSMSSTRNGLYMVDCLAEVRYLLLRRNVSLSFSARDYGYLSVSDLTLQTVRLGEAVDFPKALEDQRSLKSGMKISDNIVGFGLTF
uniref:Fibrinogen C-terminal domain-containing protein n=1 Tax=Macrostomum lignano TaxID=282301 RepID=A0A1I8H5Z6_9PLAT